MKSSEQLPTIPELLQSDAVLKKLYQNSLQGEYLFDDPQTLLRHIANKTLNPLYQDHPGIAGILGLQLIDCQTRTGVAVCGFDIIQSGAGYLMHVSHTPQGNLPHGKGGSGLARDERRRLLMSNFRSYMLTELIKLAKTLPIDAITVIASVNHPKVRGEDITYQRGCQIIDNVAISCGFEYGPDLNLWLQI